jgi:glycosidase
LNTAFQKIQLHIVFSLTPLLKGEMMISKSLFATMIFFSLFLTVTAQIPPGQQDARKAPDWVNNGIMYQIHARAFTKEGTLPAATAKLKDLSRLGVTIIYLCPIFVSDDDMRQEFWSPRQKKSGMNNPKNPYRMKDYYNVDSEYGTNNDLKEFVKTAHQLNLRVLLDLVYLHCGPAPVFLKDHPDFLKRNQEGKIVNASWSFPALNFDNPELREYLWKNMEYWVREFDVDGYRNDVADAVPLDFWIEGRKRLEKIRPDIAMLAEGTRPENQLYAYDMNYGFPIFHVIRDVMDAKKPASDLAKSKKHNETLQPKGGRFLHYIDNHDIANDDYENRREHRWGADGNEAALVACFTFDGVPMLYNGQEIADKSRHSIFGKIPIDWSKAETKEGQDRFLFCQKFIQLRKLHPALSALGATNYIDNDNPEAVLSFERTFENEKILVVINLRKKPVTVKVQSNVAPLQELLSKGKLITNEQNPTFELPEYGWFVGKVRVQE